MNRLVAQAFQPAGLPDFRVRWTRNGRLESRPNPQARKPALRTRLGSWSKCARELAWRLSMNLGWFGVPPLGGSNGLGRLKPGLRAIRGSWSQCAASKSWRLPMNRVAADVRRLILFGTPVRASLRRLLRFKRAIRTKNRTILSLRTAGGEGLGCGIPNEDRPTAHLPTFSPARFLPCDPTSETRCTTLVSGVV